MTWSVPRWLRRAALFVPALGCALLAVVFAGAGASSRALACDRAAGRCTWTTGGWPAGDERTFAIASVREVRLVEGLGKHGRQAETALVFASGHELRLARADAGAARARFARLHGFFAGQGAAVRDDSPPRRWLYLVAAAAAVAAVILGWRAAHRPIVAAIAIAPGARPAPWHRRREARLFIGAVAVAMVVQLGFRIRACTSQGTLALDCRTRCRFQGGECLPGGAIEVPLDPGDYTVEVWTASGPERWRPRPFSIAVGEVTRVVCEP